MKNNFIKESFINALTSSISTIEEAKSVFKNEISTEEKIPQGVLYNLVNRNEYIKETCQALNLNEQKLVFISGFQGTGKTEFINTLIYALEENVLDFYYECSSITHLDDIILSLFNYLKKILSKNPEYKRAFKISNSQSIDERLMNYIKSLNRPLLIVIDGFENLTEENKELIHFLEFVISLPEIKVIISGRKVNSFDFEKQKNVFQIRLSGLEDQEAYKILKDNGIKETESALQQIFQVTRGYPENLLWFSTAVNTLKISSFDLMNEYYSEEQKSFEEFIYQKIYKSIPDEFLKTICFFTVIRHSLTIETLKNLNINQKDGDHLRGEHYHLSEKINYLFSRMILTQNRGVFYIKILLKNTIYSNISADEKKQIHRYLYELYSEQISKKLEERIFPISRKLLYSEQYYHYMCLISSGDKSLPDIKTTTLSNLKPDFKYLYANVTDNLFVGDSENELAKIVPSSQKEVSSQATEVIKFEEQKTSKNILTDGIDLISDLKIELSEEEKALLSEETELISSDPVLQEENNAEDFNFQKTMSIDKNIPTENKTFASQLEEKAENLKNEANNFYEERKFDKSIEKFKESLILYENLDEQKNINLTLISMANAYNECFRHDIALMYYHRILNSEDKIIEAEPRIEALCGIADIYDYREDFENALKFYQKALEEAEKHNNTRQKANICFKKALAYDDLGDFDNALEFYLKNTQIAEDTEINPNIAASYANIAAIYEERGDLNNAKKYYSKSLKFDKLMNNKEGQYETLSNIGNIHFEMVYYQNANDCFHEALVIAKQIGDAYKIAMSCLDIGDIYLQEKHYEKALKAFIIAGKTIEKTISTDSREKIDRRLKKVMGEIGEHNFKQIIEKLKKKHE